MYSSSNLNIKFLHLHIFVRVCSLQLFRNFESYRVLVCGGDGSVSWVLNETDRLGLLKQVHYISFLCLKSLYCSAVSLKVPICIALYHEQFTSEALRYGKC